MTQHKQPVSPEQALLGKIFAEMIALEKRRINENERHDAPFATLTWKDWQETQEQVGQCLTRFRRAVEEKQSAQALMVGMEMLEVTARIFLEAYAQVVAESLNLEPIPPESVISCM
jgi:hypothetical protein